MMDADFEALRERALNGSFVRHLLGTVPRIGESRATRALGLYVDDAPGDARREHGEVRVSVLRVFGVTATGRTLLGEVEAHAPQSQALTPGTETASGISLRLWFYEGGSAPANGARELTHSDAWFVAVLERYYALGGPTLNI
ncbi:MAG: hypothetical protein ACYDCK_03190 [Thermoplasmatota archaeon]